jgi:hypothetical protein
MTLSDVLPDIRLLPRVEKIRLIQWLAKELERDESDLIEAGRSYPVWSPESAFSAAASALEALQSEKVQP